MATKKQKRRRAKEQRHEYVWVDDGGQRARAPDEVPTRKASHVARDVARARELAGAVVAADASSAGAIFAPIMFGTVLLLSPDLPLATKITQTLLIVAIFIPVQLLPRRASSTARPSDAPQRQRADRRPARELSPEPMPLRVDQLSLGPIGTNCYVVRSRAVAPTRRVVVDPSGDATELRLTLARLGARCTAILVTHGHWDHLLGVADLAEGTGAPVLHGRGRARCSSRSRATSRRPASCCGRTPRTCSLDGGETLELAGIDVRRARPFPGTRPRTSRTTRTAASSPATSCSPARSAARTSRAPTGRRSLASIRMLARRAPARDRRLSRARARSRRSATSSRGTRSSPSSARSARDEPRRREDRAPARHPRRHPCRAAALAARDDGDRAALRALRLPAHHDAGVRGHRALRADVGSRLRRRPEGDVHVRRPLRTAR